MPLSEEELRLLEQMERALVEEDPKFASTLRGTSLHTSARRRVVLAGTAFAGGVTLLMTGAIVQMPYVGVAGFVVMLLAATIGLGAFRTQRSAGPEAARQQHPSGFTIVDGGRSGRGRRQSRPRSSGSFMERLEERWRRRRESGGF